MLFNTESNQDALLLKQSFREHFQNISRILDCVGCERCRLWGKIQIIGLGTALKILFSYPEDVTKCLLSRIELVALYNTLGKYSETMFFIQKFEDLISGSGSFIETVNDDTTNRKNLIFPGFLIFNFVLLLMVLCSCLYLRYKRGKAKKDTPSSSLQSPCSSVESPNGNSPLIGQASIGRVQKRLSKSTEFLIEK